MGLGILFGVIGSLMYIFGVSMDSEDHEYRSALSKLCFISFLEWPLWFSDWKYTEGSIITPIVYTWNRWMGLDFI